MVLKVLLVNLKVIKIINYCFKEKIFLVNTLLHIFGDWLFEASVWVGQDQEGFLSKTGPHGSTKVISSAGDLSRIQDNLSTGSSILTPSQQKVCPFSIH